MVVRPRESSLDRVGARPSGDPQASRANVHMLWLHIIFGVPRDVGHYARRRPGVHRNFVKTMADVAGASC